MKKLLAAFAVMLMPLAATGCATIAATSETSEAVATADERALLTAEIAFGAALSGIDKADALGLITPEVAEKLLPLVEDAQKSISQARALYDAGLFLQANSASESAILRVAAVLQILIDMGVIS
jgi:hypothetical protein